MSLKFAFAAGASALAFAGAAHAQVVTTTQPAPEDPRDARIRALETALSDIQDQISDLKASAAADVSEVRRVASEQPTVGISNGRPTITSADGNFKFALRGMFQADAALFDQDKGGAVDNRRAGAAAADGPAARDLSSGLNFRRARIGVEGSIYKDWNYALTYEMGGSGSEAAILQQAWVEYAGFKPLGLPLRIRGGAFAATTGLEDATSNTDSVFLERPAVAELVRGLAGGDGRSGLGAFVNGDRWNASAVWTGSLIGNTGDFDEQSGYLLRLDGLLLKSEDLNLHLGVNVSGIIQPSDTTAPGTAGSTSIRLRERPELRVDGTRLVDTGNISADSLVAYGAELGFNYKNFLLAGEYFTIDVDRPGAVPDPDFDGWYAQASWVLTGERHKWGAASGGFGGVKPDKPFNLSKGDWGAWEIAARYSTLDLDFNPGTGGAPAANTYRGGQQDITTVGLNFYPNSVVRFLVDYQWVEVDRLNPSTTGNNIFTPVPIGAQIGQDFQVLAFRTQVAF